MRSEIIQQRGIFGVSCSVIVRAGDSGRNVHSPFQTLLFHLSPVNLCVLFCPIRSFCFQVPLFFFPVIVFFSEQTELQYLTVPQMKGITESKPLALSRISAGGFRVNDVMSEHPAVMIEC